MVERYLSSARSSGSDERVATPEILSNPYGFSQELGEHESLIERLSRLEDRERLALCLVHVLGEDVSALHDFGVEERDLESGERRFTADDPTRTVGERLEPLVALEPPECRQRRNPYPALAIASLFVVAILLVVTFEGAGSEVPSVDSAQARVSSALEPREEPLVQPETSAVATATTSVPPRKVDVQISDDGTIVRLDPETGDQVWESLPLRAPMIVAVHPNTIELTSLGRPLVMSLLDGTILPG